MLETNWLWFVISKEYVELTRPKIESRDPIFFTGTRSRSRVSGNDRLFPRGSEFGPNLEIPAGPAIQLRPGPGQWSDSIGPALSGVASQSAWWSPHHAGFSCVLNFWIDVEKYKGSRLPTPWGTTPLQLFPPRPTVYFLFVIESFTRQLALRSNER